MKDNEREGNRPNFVTFDANFPDDAVWDGQGNLLIPGGRQITETIKGKLQEFGIQCSDVYQHSFYGWGFTAIYNKAKFRCLLQVGEAWLLLFDQESSLATQLLGLEKQHEFEYLQEKVHHILKFAQQFSNTLWYTREDYESGRKHRASPSPYK